MKWPIFEDGNGLSIDDAVKVEIEGVAGMRIVNDQQVKYHKARIEVGTKGYFMEGARKVAECEVIELGERLSK